MQHPIGEHALLADSRTAALIDPDGNVAWLCWPWIDSTPLLFSILDADRGGAFCVRPARPDARAVSRRYHPRSLVLETVWDVGGARLIVDDALDLGEGPLLIRGLRAEGDAVDVLVHLTAPAWPGTGASLRVFGDSVELAGVSRVVIHAPSQWEAKPGGATCELTVRPGSPGAVTLGAADMVQRAVSVDSTLAEWHRTIPAAVASIDVRLPRASDLLGTTAAVLVGLRRRDGGIVAAPTTSLPQWPGSARTWDYRYAWLRDSSLAALAMLRLGLVDAAGWLGAFIGAVVTESGPIPLVRVNGTAPPEETEIPELAGYGGARPVRIGNAAAGQPQLDVPGEVIELATSLARESALPDELRVAVPILAGWLVEHWREPDHGIWEIRGAPARYTHSLITAASGLEGAAALADQRVISGDAAAWRHAAAAAVADLGTAGGALELRIDGGGADAALAQAALLGGLDVVAGRIDPTLDLIVARLGRGGLLDRYEGQPDPLSDPAAPFVFPTFWLAGALAARGRDGSPWLESALATRGPLGLFGEVADPVDHSPLGNYPQVQSHAAFVLAVTATKIPD
ncbi:MAG: glycoside hydrolase family 15 protein [Candidatus Dormiibacterota bacterium]